MKNYEILRTIYDEIKLGQRTALQVFLDLDKNRGMTGVTRDEFNSHWDTCLKHPVKLKLDAITMREQEFLFDLNQAMLSCDPPWDEILEFADAIVGVKRSQEGIRPAIEALRRFDGNQATALELRARELFPKLFNDAK